MILLQMPIIIVTRFTIIFLVVVIGNYRYAKTLSYVETNWKHDGGYDIHDYPIAFEKIVTSQTIVEQEHEREERISLVLFLKDTEIIPFLNICRRLKEHTKFFQYQENKKFHATLLGFPIVKREYNDKIREKFNNTVKKM